MKKAGWVLILILAIGILGVIFIQLNKEVVSEETAKCIGENSVLYTQLGCHACKLQEDMFGDYTDYLEIIDCWYEKELCENITATPTWLISDKSYVGVQPIETLKNLTGC